MDNQTPSEKNLHSLVEKIKQKLKLVNDSLIKPEDFTLQAYDDLLELHNMINSKQQLTMMEIEGVLDELKRLKKE